MNPKRRFLEIRDCFLALLNSLAVDTSPWTAWQISAAYSSIEVENHRETPLIYVGAPVMIRQDPFIGGLPGMDLRLTVGVWNGPKSGGTDEHIVMLDELCSLFSDKTVHTRPFDVELGGVSHTGHTLQAQGIRIGYVEGPQRLAASNSPALHSQLHVNISI